MMYMNNKEGSDAVGTVYWTQRYHQSFIRFTYVHNQNLLITMPADV